jgi:hypothetical protein
MKGINNPSETTRDAERKLSHKLRLLNRVEIVFLFLMVVLTLTSVLALTHHKSRAPKKAPAIKEISEKTTKDVRNSVTKEEPKAKKAKKP